MNTEQAYDQWAAQYDTNRNRTRDLEAIALRNTVARLPADRCLEIGCGTGKNTEWLATHCTHVTAVDFSEGMLDIARTKISALPQARNGGVLFHQADIVQPWTFADGLYDLVTFSLVLEHIADLAPVMREVARVLKPGGLVYVGELHPFKQYGGTKARFETDGGTQVVPCFDHHLSDFMQAATGAGLRIFELQEYFDEDESFSTTTLTGNGVGEVNDDTLQGIRMTSYMHIAALIAGIWALANGILHDAFVLAQHKGPYDRDLLRLMMDGHILMTGGAAYVIAYFLIKQGNVLGIHLCMLCAISLIVYCGLIFPFLRSFGTLAINVVVLGMAVIRLWTGP